MISKIFKFIKTNFLYILLIVCIFIIFIQKSYNNEKTITITRNVKIPESKGAILESTIEKLNDGSNTILYRSKVVYTENKETQEKLDQYIKENDSLKRLKMYGDAIMTREQINTFEDSLVQVKIKSRVEGKLSNMTLIDYTIKSRELPITIEQPIPKETKFALYAGGGSYYNLENQKLDYKAGVTLQNKKGSLLTLESDFKKEPTIFLDYKFRIINYKK